jgi:hypothetical protein
MSCDAAPIGSPGLLSCWSQIATGDFRPRLEPGSREPGKRSLNLTSHITMLYIPLYASSPGSLAAHLLSCRHPSLLTSGSMFWTLPVVALARFQEFQAAGTCLAPSPTLHPTILGDPVPPIDIGSKGSPPHAAHGRIWIAIRAILMNGELQHHTAGLTQHRTEPRLQLSRDGPPGYKTIKPEAWPPGLIFWEDQQSQVLLTSGPQQGPSVVTLLSTLSTVKGNDRVASSKYS